MKEEDLEILGLQELLVLLVSKASKVLQVQLVLLDQKENKDHLDQQDHLGLQDQQVQQDYKEIQDFKVQEAKSDHKVPEALLDRQDQLAHEAL